MERISALMDGELDRQQASAVFPDMRQHDEMREAWATYHLIGEAMRGQPCPDSRVAGLVARRLATEPTVLAPRASKASLRRKWAWPSIAAAAAVASVTWMASGIQGPGTVPGGSFQQAGVQSAPTFVSPSIPISNAVATFTEIVPSAPAGAQSAPPPIQLTAEGYQAYLMAHQPFSPSMSIQGLAPYMRTVGAGAAER
jgi:sigma-E factor negative regulatory protein RseA